MGQERASRFHEAPGAPVRGRGALKCEAHTPGPQYHCVETDFTCALSVCLPNQPTCDGKRATLCNGHGTAFASGGTNCPVHCAAGACVAELFREDFEDGDADGWSNSATASTSVKASAAANSSSHGLELVSSSGSASTSTQFDESRPTSIAWWQYVDETSNTSVAFDSTSYPGAATTITFHGKLVWFDHQGQASLAPNAWHHIELRNMDWQTRLCDVYLDGALRYVGFPLRPPSIGEITFGVDSASSLKVDEIQFN